MGTRGGRRAEEGGGEQERKARWIRGAEPAPGEVGVESPRDVASGLPSGAGA